MEAAQDLVLVSRQRIDVLLAEEGVVAGVLEHVDRLVRAAVHERVDGVLPQPVADGAQAGLVLGDLGLRRLDLGRDRVGPEPGEVVLLGEAVLLLVLSLDLGGEGAGLRLEVGGGIAGGRCGAGDQRVDDRRQRRCGKGEMPSPRGGRPGWCEP